MLEISSVVLQLHFFKMKNEVILHIKKARADGETKFSLCRCIIFLIRKLYEYFQQKVYNGSQTQKKFKSTSVFSLSSVINLQFQPRKYKVFLFFLCFHFQSHFTRKYILLSYLFCQYQHKNMLQIRF